MGSLMVTEHNKVRRRDVVIPSYRHAVRTFSGEDRCGLTRSRWFYMVEVRRVLKSSRIAKLSVNE